MLLLHVISVISSNTGPCHPVLCCTVLCSVLYGNELKAALEANPRHMRLDVALSLEQQNAQGGPEYVQVGRKETQQPLCSWLHPQVKLCANLCVSSWAFLCSQAAFGCAHVCVCHNNAALQCRGVRNSSTPFGCLPYRLAVLQDCIHEHAQYLIPCSASTCTLPQHIL